MGTKYAAKSFQLISTSIRRKIENLHPESKLALGLDLPAALDNELAALRKDIIERIDTGSLDEGAVGLIDCLATDVTRLAHAQTALEDVRRRRVHLIKRASAAKREVLDRHMAQLNEYVKESRQSMRQGARQHKS